MNFAMRRSASAIAFVIIPVIICGSVAEAKASRRVGAYWFQVSLARLHHPRYWRKTPNKLETIIYLPRDFILYDYIKCDVDWEHVCKADYIIEAPPGWQACKLLLNVATRIGYTFLKTMPGRWYAGDPEHPPRFKLYTIHIEAYGSQVFYDRWGSNITLTSVGIRALPADANNAERLTAGCDMPPGPS